MALKGYKDDTWRFVVITQVIKVSYTTKLRIKYKRVAGKGLKKYCSRLNLYTMCQIMLLIEQHMKHCRLVVTI